MARRRPIALAVTFALVVLLLAGIGLVSTRGHAPQGVADAAPDPATAPATTATTVAAPAAAAFAPPPDGRKATTTTSTGTAATTPSSSTSTTSTTAPDDGTVSMVFGGDALWHSPLWNQASVSFAAAQGASAQPGYDFRPMLADIAPVVAAADLAVCHLETPIAPVGEELSTAPLYGVPPDVVTAIAAAGFDRCSTASNHTADRGTAGIDRTVSVLEAAGLGQSGMARTPAEIEPHVFTVDGVAISHLSYTFSYNGLHLPSGEEWRSALIDPTRIIADATTARALGAEVVIVSLHWGVEGQSAVTPAQRALAEQLTASGVIDLIVGHHAHVVQPIEQVNGVWVIYGLGNMISNMPTGDRWPAATQDGALVGVTFTRRTDGLFEVSTPVVTPTWCDRDAGWIVRLVAPTLADPATPDGLRWQLETSLERTRTVLGPYVAP